VKTGGLLFGFVDEICPWCENGVHGYNWIFGKLESPRSYLAAVVFGVLFFLGGF
jgi:hypothetical protein